MIHISSSNGDNFSRRAFMRHMIEVDEYIHQRQ